MNATPLTTPALQMGGETVPQFAYDIDAYRAMRELPEHRKDYALKMIGPAVKYGIKANRLLWSFFVGYPTVLVCIVCFVRPGSDAEGLMEFPLLTLLPYAPVLICSLWWEYQGLKFVMPAAVTFVGSPRICGRDLTFAEFCFVAWPLSVVSHMDVVTNALFIANLSATISSSPKFVDAWSHWRQGPQGSQVSQGSLASIESLALALVGWIRLPWMPVLLGTLVLLQPICVFAAVKQIGSVTNNRNGSEFPCDYELKCASQMPNQVSVYRTRLEPVQTHMGAIMALAGGARQATICFQESTYMRKVHSMRRVGTTAYKVMKKESLLGSLQLVVETALFLNVQTNAIFANKFVTGKINRSTQVSIILSVLAGLRNIFSLAQRLISYYADVELGHQAFNSLSPKDRDERLRNYAQEERVCQDAQTLLMGTLAVLGVSATLTVNAALNACLA